MPNITTVYNSGLDALANLFEVNIDLSGTAGDFFDESVSEEIVFRIQDFPIPASGSDKYEVEWGPWTFDRPNGKVNPNREVSFEVRLDRNYAIYQGFVNWKNAIKNEYTGVVSNYKDYTTDITVYPVTSTVGTSNEYVLSTVGQGAKFEEAWVSEVGEISYDQGSGDPLTVSVTFTFLRVEKDFHTPSGSSSEVGATDTGGAL